MCMHTHIWFRYVIGIMYLRYVNTYEADRVRAGADPPRGLHRVQYIYIYIHIYIYRFVFVYIGNMYIHIIIYAYTYMYAHTSYIVHNSYYVVHVP